MRGLTIQETENAPDWATHYRVCADYTVIYESEDKFKINSIHLALPNGGIDPDCRPIKRLK